MNVFIFQNRLKTYIISILWSHILKNMPPLLRTPATHQEHQHYQELAESFSSQQMKAPTNQFFITHWKWKAARVSSHSANIIFWDRRWKQILLGARPCVYSSKAELVKKWGFYSIWFLQDNVDNQENFVS